MKFIGISIILVFVCGSAFAEDNTNQFCAVFVMEPKQSIKHISMDGMEGGIAVHDAEYVNGAQPPIIVACPDGLDSLANAHLNLGASDGNEKFCMVVPMRPHSRVERLEMDCIGNDQFMFLIRYGTFVNEVHWPEPLDCDARVLSMSKDNHHV